MPCKTNAKDRFCRWRPQPLRTFVDNPATRQTNGIDLHWCKMKTILGADILKVNYFIGECIPYVKKIAINVVCLYDDACVSHFRYHKDHPRLKRFLLLTFNKFWKVLLISFRRAFCFCVYLVESEQAELTSLHKRIFFSIYTNGTRKLSHIQTFLFCVCMLFLLYSSCMFVKILCLVNSLL